MASTKSSLKKTFRTPKFKDILLLDNNTLLRELINDQQSPNCHFSIDSYGNLQYSQYVQAVTLYVTIVAITWFQLDPRLDYLSCTVCINGQMCRHGSLCVWGSFGIVPHVFPMCIGLQERGPPTIFSGLPGEGGTKMLLGRK
jgi:hypothetical protein